MGKTPRDPRDDRRNFMPLKEERARCLETGRMSTGDLWRHVQSELNAAIDDISQARRREAFYRLVRVRQATDELWVRGEQLRMFTALGESHETLQHWQDNGR